jgi:uncharacterized protein (TIGR02246 family)
VTLVDPEAVIDALVKAYNAHDARGFAGLFAEDVVVRRYHGEVVQRSRAEIEEHYVKTFAEFPENRTEAVNRITVGNCVIDHERVFRTNTSQPIEVAAIYTISEGRITHLDFVSVVPVG